MATVHGTTEKGNDTRGESKQENPLLRAAQHLASRYGLPVFPLRPRGKEPLTEHGFKDATRDPYALWKAWKQNPDANIGIATGSTEALKLPHSTNANPGVVVVDVDPRNGGEIGIEQLESAHGPLPETVESHTGGGGRHLFFAHPGGHIPCSSSKIAPGVDVKADGGYIIAPPSIHPSGAVYEWEVTHGPDDIPLSPLPEWLHALLIAQSNSNGFRNGKSTHANMDEVERQKTLAELREALPFIPAIEHDIWLQVGMGLHFVDSGEASFAVWIEWSRTCLEKFDQADCLKRWRSFHDDGGITHKSIFALAITHGWRAASRTELPTIVVNNRPLRKVSDDSVGALLKKNAPPALFIRSGRLVRRLYDEHMRPMLDTLTEPALCGFLTRSAEFLKRTTSEEDGTVKDVHVPPPLPVVRDVYSLGSWPFPALIGITECPVFRPDGTVCSVAGYDAVTRLLYDPAPSLLVPPLPDSPSEADARKAAQYILTELFSNFPFCDGADLANMVGCLLTPIVRPAIPGNVPLCLIDKPAPGSGATLLSDLVSIVATGEHAAKLLAPEGRGAEEEWRKKMTALLADGSPVAVIDNVENSLGSSALSLLLTSSRWKDRILGKTETITLPVRVCLIATANNISVRGDLARRCYRVRIDAQEERPWTRTEFRHPDLLNWTRTHRGEILACLLTMARAWFVAKPPKADVSTLGMFEQWTHTIGGILAFSGVPGFLTNLDELYELVDDEGPAWAAFLKALHTYFQDEWFTTAKIANATGSEMYGAIPDSIGWDESKAASSRKRLGKAFQKRADRVYAGFRLTRSREKDAIQNAARWRVVRVIQKETRQKKG
jgi:hypothetical protein